MFSTHKPIRKAFRHIGRRGAYLGFMALVFFTTLLSFQDPDQVAMRKLIYPALDPVPTWVWMWMWAVSMCMCLLGIVWKRAEIVGFAATTFVFVIWSVIISSALFYHTQSLKHVLLALLVYISFLAMTLMIAGWPEYWKEDSDDSSAG